MPPRGPEADLIRVRHMMEYAQKAVQFARGHTRADLDSNEMLSLATVYLIEIVGEAAYHVSDAMRRRYPAIPWESICGVRNQLAHGYIDVDLDIIWTIVTQDLPPLITKLKRILKEEQG